MHSLFIAGASGYLGRHLCAEFSRRGFYVTALVRNAKLTKELSADCLIEAEATKPSTLTGVMEGADLVVSSLGITRQVDGLNYRDVDYQANFNLLNEAVRAKVNHFAYIHVLNANKMPDVPLVAAKAAFVSELQASSMTSTIIAPSGFFSDMGDFFSMAKSGRAWLFGDGQQRINPIHGVDLAVAACDAIVAKREWLDVGGPESFTHDELAKLAFKTLNRPAKITHLPDFLREVTLKTLPLITPRHIHGPAQFFLTAMGMNMIGEPHGTRRLIDHFKTLVDSDEGSKER